MARNLWLASLLSASTLADAACTPRASTKSSSNSSGVIAATYFAGYHIDDGFTVADIPWEKYSEVKYAFA